MLHIPLSYLRVHHCVLPILHVLYNVLRTEQRSLYMSRYFTCICVCVCVYSSNNFALQAKRKTLAASDVLSALSDMEFEEFVPELKSFLESEHVL